MDANELIRSVLYLHQIISGVGQVGGPSTAYRKYSLQVICLNLTEDKMMVDV